MTLVTSKNKKLGKFVSSGYNKVLSHLGQQFVKNNFFNLLNYYFKGIMASMKNIFDF